jgi:hypothetical protein
MNTKTTEPKTTSQSFQYTKEDLAPCDFVTEEAFMDAFLERNKEAINASIKLSRKQFARGEYFTEAQVLADLEAQFLRRHNAK